jgi:hypothetical protein
MLTMQSMELTDDEKLDAVMPIPMPEKPEFPYGLRICLTEKELEKLKLDGEDAEVGGMFHLHGLARVTSVSMTDTPEGKCCRIEAQIEDLAIESEDAENK